MDLFNAISTLSLTVKLLKYQILTIAFMKRSDETWVGGCGGSSVSVWVQW